MVLRMVVPALAALLVGGCNASAGADGRSQCTKTALAGLGPDHELKATAHLPQSFTFTEEGGPFSNGGLSLSVANCDYALNALFSEETARKLIENAPPRTLSERLTGRRIVEIKVGVLPYERLDSQSSFFVTSLKDMKSVMTPRNEDERRLYEIPE